MRILFICGSLEKGKDGVGDYIYRLGESLLQKGHQVQVLAISDKYISEIQSSNSSESENPIAFLRIPYKLKWNESQEISSQYIRDFDPDWISLQYVIFAYNDKGLPFGLNAYLGAICKGRNVHLMFHELWLGLEKRPSLKYTIWGALQGRMVIHLLRQLKPKLIHTHSKSYAAQLKVFNIEADILPLFSNIPNLFEKDFKEISVLTKINFVIFGHISLNAPVKEFVKELKLFCSKSNKTATLSLVGRSNSEEELWTNTWEREGFEVNVYGIQSPEKISEILSHSDIGISTTPYALIEKSGSTMALLEHGLPVINVSEIWKANHQEVQIFEEGVYPYEENKLEETLYMLQPSSTTDRLEAVSNIFINSISSSKDG